MRRPVDPTRRPRTTRLTRGDVRRVETTDPRSPQRPRSSGQRELISPADPSPKADDDLSAATAPSAERPAPWDMPTSATPLAPEEDLSALSRLVSRARQPRPQRTSGGVLARLPIIGARLSTVRRDVDEEDNPFLLRLRESRRARRRLKHKRISLAVLFLVLFAAVLWAVAYSPLFALDRAKITVEQGHAVVEPNITPNRVLTDSPEGQLPPEGDHQAPVSPPEEQGVVNEPSFQFIDPNVALNEAYPYEGVSLARLPVGRIRQEIIDKLPAAKSVSIDRQWPNGLRIVIVERTPVARVAQGEAVTLVDADGITIAEVAGDDPRAGVVPQLIVPLGDSEVTAKLVDECLDALNDLTAPSAKRIASVTADESSGVVFVLDDQAKVRWGDASDGELKAAVLETLLQTAHKYYDVSAPRNPVTRD